MECMDDYDRVKVLVLVVVAYMTVKDENQIRSGSVSYSGTSVT